jgi:soluble lytic murein transglycosylase-like protein
MRALYITSLVALVGAAPVTAEEPAQFREFTFKMVKPPKAGSNNRINIQIEPEDLERQRGKSSSLVSRPATEADEPKADGEAKPTPKQKTGTYAWFWDKISPNIAESAPGRLAPALVAVNNGPGGKAVLTPRLETLRAIVEVRGAEILKATIGTEVSPALVLAVIAIESGGRVDAVSSAGAQGLMQLMPAVAERFGVSDALLPAENIKGGVAYLDALMKEFDRDPILVLAGYNAGENAVKRAGGVPDYAETRDYVPKVLAAFQTAKGLCVTPPELASDGCVFNFKMAKAD